jgi:hypothetical protein
VRVNGQPVLPGGHRLVAAANETSRLAFLEAGLGCRAGDSCSALLQLLDSQGHSMQVRPPTPIPITKRMLYLFNPVSFRQCIDSRELAMVR